MRDWIASRQPRKSTSQIEANNKQLEHLIWLTGKHAERLDDSAERARETDERLNKLAESVRDLVDATHDLRKQWEAFRMPP